MSIFTMSLQEVIELHGRNNIGLSVYPVLGEEYRQRLNDKIIDEYLNREIAHETVSLWRHAMQRKMSQIMPYYNRMYATETLIIDPLRTVNLQTLTTSTGENESETTSNTTTEGESDQNVTSGTTSREVSSDTPQVLLSGNSDYASGAADGRSDVEASTTAKENAKADVVNSGQSSSIDVMNSSVTGFQGNQAQLLSDYRATILNIDMLIVNELESLFMGVWSNGDSFYNKRGY